MEMVSSVAVDPSRAIYLLQRGAKADPVIVADREGRILRSWGKGLYKIPHSIRVDPEGNIWTVDAASSMVYKFTRDGKKLLAIDVGGLPSAPRSEFCGTTDIAFTPGGRILISDGYANARILEYNTAGKRVREWGTPGTGPGQFHLPHGIAIDRDGIVYVADRENGRIQRFSLEGRYIGEWGDLGKTFSLKITPGGDLWIGTQPRNVPNGSEGWIVKVDLAGICSDDLEIQIDESSLRIRGCRRDTFFKEGFSYQQMEITYSRFEKTIQFPCSIEEASLAHDYRDGFLIVTLHCR